MKILIIKHYCLLIFYTYNLNFLANCYKKVKNETTEFQEAIEKELGLAPIEQEVVVLYKGEKIKQPEEFWKVLQI